MSNMQLARLRGLSGDELLDALAESERQLAAVQAEQLQILALLEQRPSSLTLPGSDDKHWVREQVACVLNCSPEFAGHRLAQAARLDRLAAIGLLADARASFAQLRLLADQLAPLDEESALAVAARVLPNAGEQSYAAFRAAVRRAVLTLAPKTDAAERAHNVADRRVRIEPSGTGVMSLWALLPEEQASAVAAAITAAAGAVGADDPRTGDQRRADALIHLILNGDRTDLPGQPSLRPAINVCVALSTLLELDDEPGQLDGVGPIPAALARRLAHDRTGTWRRIVTDPRGRLIDYGRSTYRPPTTLAEHITARDRTCRFPHCTRRAVVLGKQAGEIDHRVAWSAGGSTNQHNLQVLCSRHHHLKDETRMTTNRRPDGTTTWVDHRGRRYVQPLDAYPVGTGERLRR